MEVFFDSVNPVSPLPPCVQEDFTHLPQLCEMLCGKDIP